MSRLMKAIVILNLVVSLFAVSLILWLWLKPGSFGRAAAEEHISRAAAFEASSLFKAAALEYQRAAENSRGQQAFNYWLKAGDLCYEKAMDYQCAGESYLSAKASGRFKLGPDTATRLVNSLKNLGRSAEAQAWLNDLTALNPKPGEGATVVARIGEKELTLAELKAAFADEPSEVKKNFAGANSLRSYLNYYLFSRLLYQAALDQGMLDEEASQALERFKEKYLSDRFYRKNFMSRIELSDRELKDYYDRHPAEFKDDKGNLKKFDEVRSEIETKLKRARAQELNELWLREQTEKRGIIIHEEAFSSSK